MIIVAVVVIIMHCNTTVRLITQQQQQWRRVAASAMSTCLPLPMMTGKNSSCSSTSVKSSHHQRHARCNKDTQRHYFDNLIIKSDFSTIAKDASSPPLSSRQHYWDINFNSLKDYKSTHGDTFVPATYPQNPQLGNWVDNQRQLYRMRQEAEERGESKSTEFITDERIDKLNSIGFVWNVNDHQWNLRFEELKQYISENGNSCVPGIYIPNESLGLWVAKQRRRYKVGLEANNNNNHTQKQDDDGDGHSINETTEIVPLPQEKIDKLNAVGFVWDMHEASWLERYEELKKYRRDHGDTLVPKQYPVYPFLGRWVDKQRSDYKRFLARKKLEEGIELKDHEERQDIERLALLSTGMTEERVRLLNAEDFIWDAFNHAWEQKYDELCMFVAVNGHAAIRSRRKGYDPLARWAEIQRQNYRKRMNGEKTTLTKERVDKLERIGFIWDRTEARQLAKAAAGSSTADSSRI